MKKWTAKNINNARYLGIIEFQDNQEEWHNFEVVLTECQDYFVFGGACNVGLLQSGYMKIDNCFSIDENLQELIADLETYYNDGKQYVTNIVCNDRM